MKKIILLILILLLIPFFIITIKDIDREEVNPTLTYNLTTTDSTFTDLNNHPLQVFDIVPDDYGYTLPNGTKNGFSHHDGKSYYIQRVSDEVVFDGVDEGWLFIINTNDIVRFQLPSAYDNCGIDYTISLDTLISNLFLYKAPTFDHTGESMRENQNSPNILNIFISSSRLVGWDDGWTYAQKVTAFKSWLSSNNLIIRYLLATPIETELFDIDTITEADLDAWYTIYQTYHTTYTTLTLGTTTPTTYASLQQLITDNDDKDFKLYRDDIADESHYRLTQESGYISIINDDDLEIIRINDDDTFESSLQIDDTIDYKLVGYNVTSYIDGSFDNTILAFVWIIPILLIGGFFFVIFSHRKED